MYKDFPVDNLQFVEQYDVENQGILGMHEKEFFSFVTRDNETILAVQRISLDGPRIDVPGYVSGRFMDKIRKLNEYLKYREVANVYADERRRSEKITEIIARMSSQDKSNEWNLTRYMPDVIPCIPVFEHLMPDIENSMNDMGFRGKCHFILDDYTVKIV